MEYKYVNITLINSKKIGSSWQGRTFYVCSNEHRPRASHGQCKYVDITLNGEKNDQFLARKKRCLN